MQHEARTVRENTWMYWLFLGPSVTPGADRYWKMRAYTKRLRRWISGSAILFFVAVLLFFASGGFTHFLPRLLPMVSTRPVSWILPGLLAFALIRIAILPVVAYMSIVARRIRRADGCVCWDCGRLVGEQESGRCACGNEWNRNDLREFWIATELLPASTLDVRGARFRIGGKNEIETYGPAVGLARLFSPLRRSQMSCWQQRPITVAWLKRAIFLSSGFVFLVFFVLVLSTLLLARTLSSGSVFMFVFGTITVGTAVLAIQIGIMRGAMSIAVRAAKARVQEAEGLICTDCGFVLAGLNDATTCPECGESFSQDEVRAFFRSCGILDDNTPAKRDVA